MMDKAAIHFQMLGPGEKSIALNQAPGFLIYYLKECLINGLLKEVIHATGGENKSLNNSMGVLILDTT